MMTVSLEWICAIVAPRDLAPHPNFMSEEVITFPSLLAGEASFDGAVWMRFHDIAEQLGETSPRDLELLQCVRSMAPFDGQSNVDDSLTLLAELPTDRRVALTLLVVASLAAAERQDELFDVLAEAKIAVVREKESPEQGVLLSILELQEAFRRYERGTGEDYNQLEILMPRLEARLRSVDMGYSWERFPTSLGTGWDGSQTVRHVLEELWASYRALEETILTPLRSEGWKDLVRTKASYLSSVGARRALGAYESLTQQQWDTGPYSRTRTVFNQDPILTPMQAALLHAEVTASAGDAKKFRRDLALVQLVSPYQHLGPERDGSLTLLRRARNERMLRSALTRARAEGPLEPLTSDAERLARWVQWQSITKEGLLVLRSASQVLSIEDLSSCLTKLPPLIEALQQGEYLGATRWSTADAVEIEAWATLFALGEAVGDMDTPMAQLHDRVRKGALLGPQLVHRLPALMANVDWEDLSPTVSGRWLDWVVGEVHHRDSPESFASNILDAVPWMVRHLPSGIRTALLNQRQGFREIGLLLDSTRFVPSFEYSLDQRADVVEFLREALHGLVEENRRGIHRMGAYSELSVAVSAYLDAGLTELWPDLAQTLATSWVPLASKEPALFALAAAEDRFEPAVAERLIEICRDLVHTPPLDDPFEPVSQPPHSAPIALLWALRPEMRSTQSVDELLFRLTAHEDPRSRRVGAQLLSGKGEDALPDWMPLLLIQLAVDADATVRAEAARSLGMTISRGGRWIGALTGALVPLIEDSSLLVPLASLRGLAKGIELGGSGPFANDDLRKALLTASGHPARIVRAEAFSRLSAVGG